MNRKNPDCVELEIVSQDEERHWRLYSALGWTIAAVIYTAMTLWQRHSHMGATYLFGWLMAALFWGAWWYEWRKAERTSSTAAQTRDKGEL